MAGLRLYQFITSPFCAKVRKILDYKGIDYEISEVDYLDRRELLAASGQLMVPALTIAGGETLTDSESIAHRVEQLYPEPTILPAEWGGIHLALARYFETELEDLLFRTAVRDELEYFRAHGAQHEALWRLIRERRYGAGFCDQMVGEQPGNLARVEAVLRPLDAALEGRAFLLGRIGYGDFALYGQLNYLAFTGELKIPAGLSNLRAFFARIDRITALIEAPE